MSPDAAVISRATEMISKMMRRRLLLRDQMDAIAITFLFVS
ncbi:hypothetical protein VA596_33475 [Amycolatopsis sp., V23-08]|uniref:Uncharacterized protein n=1 Tax=Amycolatopsis heterodermiae TaxID=3110235 RepID=A0ABU5RFF9_9PSEU|nr:hypothetical protein [Amycolatopsis sp., V23-08]MEA5364484.1 hypothetical protein [Amycolatopsis sp., V23-08]